MIKSRFVLSLLAGVTLSAFSTAALAKNCATESEKIGLGTRVVLSDMMVAALSCRQSEPYNALMEKFKAHFQQAGDNMKDYFRRNHGSAYNYHMNNFVTKLANEASERSVQGSKREFCNKMRRTFSKIQSLNAEEFVKFVSEDEYTARYGVQACDYKVSQKN